MSVDQALGTVGNVFGSFTLNISLGLLLKVLFTVVICLIAVKVIGGVIARVLNACSMRQASLAAVSGDTPSPVSHWVSRRWRSYIVRATRSPSSVRRMPPERSISI